MQTDAGRHRHAPLMEPVEAAANQLADSPGGERSSVGYKKPPIEHRFRKGCSGNPKGRPRKKPATNVGRTIKNAETLMLEEAYRMVSIREGDKVIKLPAIQAVMRGLGVAAMKGDRRAQLAFKEHTHAVELKQHDEKIKLFTTYIEYKDRWTNEIKRCEKLGLERPNLWLHPDDIKLDSSSLEVQIVAPMGDVQKADWNEIWTLKENLITAIAYEGKRAKRYPELREEAEKDREAAEQLIAVIDFTCPDEATRRHPAYKRDFTKMPDISALIKYAKSSQRADLALIVARGPVQIKDAGSAKPVARATKAAAPRGRLDPAD